MADLSAAIAAAREALAKRDELAHRGNRLRVEERANWECAQHLRVILAALDAADVTDEYARAFHDGWLACERGDAEPPVPAQQPAAAVPEGMVLRVDAALRRIHDGHCIRRIPADPTDPDLVLAEVLAFLRGEKAPFWAPETKEAAALATNKEPSTPRFADQGDGTVIDNATRLQWSKATLTRARVSQREALKLCEGLSLGGHGDWRLPTRAELLTLVDDTRHQPAINVDAFPDTTSGWYWTSTVCVWSSSLAWYVDFSHGYCSGAGVRRCSNGFVRAVRSVPVGKDKSAAHATFPV